MMGRPVCDWTKLEKVLKDGSHTQHRAAILVGMEVQEVSPTLTAAS